MQAAEPGLEPEEQRRLRNRALARWLIAAGPARLRPGGQPVRAELVVHDGRVCAAVTGPNGQVLALYPVSGSGERRRLYQAVPIPASRPLPPPRSPFSPRAHAALLARSQELLATWSAVAWRSRALCQASALLRARSRELRAPSPGPGPALDSFTTGAFATPQAPPGRSPPHQPGRDQTPGRSGGGV